MRRKMISVSHQEDRIKSCKIHRNKYRRIGERKQQSVLLYQQKRFGSAMVSWLLSILPGVGVAGAKGRAGKTCWVAWS